MNREQTVAAAKIMMAWVNGKDIEGKKQGENNWGDTTKTGLEPAWDWFLYEYRIKPEPIAEEHRKLEQQLETELASARERIRELEEAAVWMYKVGFVPKKD
jgi:hypothetical protein